MFSSDLKNVLATGVFDSIGVSLTPDYVELIYSHGWGDCPSGCIYRKFYNFKVYNDCSVECTRTFQLSVADEKQHSLISVFPNPATNSIKINEDSKYEILNVFGNRVKNGIVSIENLIDISELRLWHLFH